MDEFGRLKIVETSESSLNFQINPSQWASVARDKTTKKLRDKLPV